MINIVIPLHMADWSELEQLHFASAEGDLARVRALVEAGADVNLKDQDLSLTPLHHAAMCEQCAVASFLLSVGADVNANDPSMIGETPLGEIAQSCTLAMAEILINGGANPLIRGNMGINALDRAAKRKKPEGVSVYNLLLSTARHKFHYQG